MAMKVKVTAAEFAAMTPAMQIEYAKDGDGYTLELIGAEDTSALKRAKDREAQARKDAEDALAAAKAEIADLSGNDAKRSGDIKALEKQWQVKIDAANAIAEKATGQVKTLLLTAEAGKLAAELSPHGAKLLLPHITGRLSVDMTGDAPKIVVLDAAGKPTAQKVEELGAEFRANKDFSSIIAVSRASGGGAPTAAGAAPGGAQAQDGKPVNLATADSATAVSTIAARIAARQATP